MTTDSRRNRPDLGLHLVHLTKGQSRDEAFANLLCIVTGSIKAHEIEGARLVGTGTYGAVARSLVDEFNLARRKVVCFTETPLFQLRDLVRGSQYSEYGVGVPAAVLQARGAERVWYINTTGGEGNSRPWRDGDLRAVFAAALKSDRARIGPRVEELLPFLDVAGTGKDFSHEREWRYLGDLDLQSLSDWFIIAPEADHAALSHVEKPLVDLNWTAEVAVARLLDTHSR